MSEAKHTPGPWRITRSPKPQASTDRRDWPQLIHYNDGKYEGVLAIVQTDRAEANARLIAAAPDLLEAAANAVNAFDSDDGGLPKAIDLLESAIKKATGGAS